MLHKGIFIDLNGVILELPPAIKDGTAPLEGDSPESYTMHPKDVVLLSNAVDGLKKLMTTDYKIYIVSNQSCIGRGLCSEKDMATVFHYFSMLLEREDITVQTWDFCPHAPDDGCGCRKPAPGMLWKLIVQHEIDRSKSWMIGDSMSDIEAGERAEIPNLIKIDNGEEIIGYTGKYPITISGNLLEAAKVILRRG